MARYIPLRPHKLSPWNTSCFFAQPFDRVCRMTLSQFKEHTATRLGVEPDSFDLYSLGNKLEDMESELWTQSYVTPGALLEMRRRSVVSSESASARDL